MRRQNHIRASTGNVEGSLRLVYKLPSPSQYWTQSGLFGPMRALIRAHAKETGSHSVRRSSEELICPNLGSHLCPELRCSRISEYEGEISIWFGLRIEEQTGVGQGKGDARILPQVAAHWHVLRRSRDNLQSQSLECEIRLLACLRWRWHWSPSLGMLS